MVTFPLKLDDQSADVVTLQDALNRMGALLAEDGKFGPGTAAAVKNAQRQFGLAPTGTVDTALWDRLHAVAPPSALLPTRGVTFIAIEEIGSRANYDSLYHHPSWPGGQSGITIGIGFDLRFASPQSFDAHWSSLDPATLAALRPWLGKLGTKQGAASLKSLSIPFGLAWSTYCDLTIPDYVGQTDTAFTGYEGLPPLCKSALVSLVYNRGTSLSGPSRTEMANIHRLIASGDLPAVPAQIEAMKRLWPEGNGLRARRDREAALWQAGLA